jgi:hypothetical protein
MALQDWFRDPNEFSYSLEVQAGHGSSAIEIFFNERVGYCEQFSATFATMARTLGIPSRVAVGFTPGVLNDEGWYSVIGKNAHAWPELWFDGIGWVPFEPTPGRGAPGAEDYTGVAPAQDDSGPSTGGGRGGDPTVSTLPPTPTTAVPPQTSVAPGGAPPVTTNRRSSGGGPLFEEDVPPVATSDTSSGVPWRVLTLIFVLLVALIAPGLVRKLRERRGRSGDLAQRVERAWQRAVVAAQQAGVRGAPSMTVHEWAAVTASQLPVAARPMSSLAEVVDEITFAPPGAIDLERRGSYGSTLGHDCELWADQIRRIAIDGLTGTERLKRYFTTWS